MLYVDPAYEKLTPLRVQVARDCGQTIAANQVLFSLLDFNSPELQRMIRVCRANGITVIAYSVLGQGLLTESLSREKYGSIRATKMLRGLTYDRLTPLRECIQQIAESHGKTMSQVCLRWAQQHGTIPLVGVRSVSQMQDAVGSVSGDWELTKEEMETLDRNALDISTLEKPLWKRYLFVVLISLLLFTYMITRWLRAPQPPPPRDDHQKRK